jgi:hypothetical protein
MPVGWRAPDFRRIWRYLVAAFFVRELRWSELEAKICSYIVDSENKAFSCGFFSWRCRGLQLCLLFRRGAERKLGGATPLCGELRKAGGVGADRSALGRSTTVVRLTIDLASRRTATPGVVLTTFFSQPPDGRPYSDSLPALHVFLSPSGWFPGGEDDGRRRCRSSGGGHGFDRFSFQIFRVLVAYLQDYVVMFACVRVLTVIWLVTARF